MWHTPKGIIDEGGVMLDGYLNFNITLLGPPVNNVMSVSMQAGGRACCSNNACAWLFGSVHL